MRPAVHGLWSRLKLLYSDIDSSKEIGCCKATSYGEPLEDHSIPCNKIVKNNIFFAVNED
jgi:hypothetical protein